MPARVAGMAIALVNTGLFLGAAVMQPAFGWVLDLTWDRAMREGVRLYGRADYLNGLWLSFGCALVAAHRMRETRCQQG